MLLILAAAVLGAFVGARSARRRGGQPLDLAQYAAAHAIAFALGALLLTVLADLVV